MIALRLGSRGFIAMMLVGGAASAQSAANPPKGSIEPLDTGYVNYDSGPISLPLGIGLRLPSYNRVDGLVIPWGPSIRLAGVRVAIDPTVTYRSNLGAFDPRLQATIALAKPDTLRLSGGRSTFTNDGWIRSDIINSIAAFFVGSDSRNYFRADRGTAELAHSVTSGSITYTPRIGLLHEYAWSTGIHRRHTEAPWSVIGRKDTLKMRRINPSILKGHTTSALGSVGAIYEQGDVTASADAGVEHAFDAPAGGSNNDGQFTQLTVGSEAAFPTFGTQHFEFRGHAVTGFGDEAPPQRWVYLGGAGTLATVDLLALGGDRLLFVEGEYFLPLPKPLLPFVGSPVVSLRYAAGAAGVDKLPDFVQNLGIALGVKLVKVEFHLDPNYTKTPYTHKTAISIGFSLSL